MRYMYFLFVVNADRYICKLITKVSGNFTHSSVQLFVMSFFLWHIYIKHIYFLTMCLIFSKFILFWFLTYFAGLAINTIGFHPEIVMNLYTACIPSWCIDKLNDKLHVIQYLLVWFNKFLNIVSFSCSTVPWASVHTSSSIGGRGNILKKYQKYF